MMVTVQNDVQEIHLQVVDHLSPKKKSAQRSGGERALGLIEKELVLFGGYPEQVRKTDPRRNQVERGTQEPVCGPMRTLALPAG